MVLYHLCLIFNCLVLVHSNCAALSQWPGNFRRNGVDFIWFFLFFQWTEQYCSYCLETAILPCHRLFGSDALNLAGIKHYVGVDFRYFLIIFFLQLDNDRFDVSKNGNIDRPSFIVLWNYLLCCTSTGQHPNKNEHFEYTVRAFIIG